LLSQKLAPNSTRARSRMTMALRKPCSPGAGIPPVRGSARWPPHHLQGRSRAARAEIGSAKVPGRGSSDRSRGEGAQRELAPKMTGSKNRSSDWVIAGATDAPFFMKFRGRNAHPTRIEKPAHRLGDAGDLAAGRRVQPAARPPALPAGFSSRFAGRSAPN